MTRRFPTGYVATSVILAGTSIADAADQILAYIEAPGTFSTLDYFDRAAHDGRFYHLLGESRQAITQSSIDAANWIGAQLTRSYVAGPPLDWFGPQELSAPWHLINPKRRFVDADPSIPGGEYDDLSRIWFHFYNGTPKGIGPTQINKVLHQIYPNLFPIFDKRLRLRYASEIKFESTRVKSARAVADPSAKFMVEDKNFDWEPMRVDIVRESPKLPLIRRQLSDLPCDNHLRIHGEPVNVWASQNLSDIRIFDILLWTT